MKKRIKRETQAPLRARRLAEASKKVRKESLRVNRQFAAIESNLVAEKTAHDRVIQRYSGAGRS
jgi:hypothetical protein